jgi:hypothetical protein
VSKPFTIIPMVVTGVQDYVAAGQFRGGEQLIDAQQVARPGTLLVFLRQMLSRRICFPSHMAQKLVHLFARELAKGVEGDQTVGFRVLTKRQRRAASDAGSATAKLTGGPNADTAPP